MMIFKCLLAKLTKGNKQMETKGKRQMKIAHIRNYDGKGIGTLAAVIDDDGKIKFGLALINHGDTFVKETGREIAIQNALTGKPVIYINPNKDCDRHYILRAAINNFTVSCSYYFRQLTLGEFRDEVKKTFVKYNRP